MSTIRELSRFARRVPIVRHAVEAGDPRRRAERLARLGIIDAPLYAAQLGVPSITVEEAATHYASVGFRLGYTLNVLTDPYVLRRSMIRTDRPALYDYFNSSAWLAQTTEVWSALRYADEHPESRTHPAGPVGHLWERVTRDPSTEIVIEAGGAHPVPWSEIYPVLRAATAEWAELERDREARYPRAELVHAESLPPSDVSRGGKVSIVMPVWNRGGAMRRAVESIIAQTWSDWELLIVDDGSWDDTIAAAELLAARDPRIRLLRRDHLGVCAARNSGIAEASGEFIAFLDSDNTWQPTFLHDMVTTMTRDGVVTAYATIAMDDELGTRYRYGAPELRSLQRGNSIDLNTLVSRRDAIEQVGGFDPTLRRAVDYDLILKLAAFAPIVHVPTLGARYDNSENASDRISTTEAFGWNTEVRLRHSAEEDAGDITSVPDVDTTLVCLVQRHDPALSTKLLALTDAAETTDLRIVGVGLKPDEWRHVRAYASERAGVSATLHQSGETYAYVVNRELRRSTAPVFGVIDPRSLFTADGITQLRDEIASNRAAAVIPLTLGTDGTIESVGSLLAWPRRTPAAILGGHPAEDARRLGARLELRALSGRSVFVSREVVAGSGGLDPLLYNEYELAGLANIFEGHPLLARTDVAFTQLGEELEFAQLDPNGTDAAIRARLAGCEATPPEDWYAPLGMRVSHWRRSADAPDEDADDDAPPPREALVPVVTRDRSTTTLDGRVIPRLRWAIKTASPSGPAGETWGDTHFGRALADALTALGQEAVVDAREAQHRESEYLDDIVVHLRGLDELVPSQGALSYLWVISHPDMVARSEAQRFDRVFAASLSWAAQATRRWSFPVEPLLQCTDPERFRPEGVSRRNGILFVGNSRGIPRPTVMESVRGGLPLELYGGDWERFVPEQAITGTRVDNASLGEMYAGAAVVLNDHWADMQREGFISNRLFDVVAAGGRVYSDAVSGIEEIFQGAVQTYRSVSEIIPFLSSDLDARFPDEDELTRIRDHVRAEHSFATRARVLLEHAITDIEGRGPR